MPEATRAERLAIDRDLLESAMAEAEAKELPALIREHRQVLKELETLAVPAKGSIRDQLAEKRATRKAGAPGTPAAEVR